MELCICRAIITYAKKAYRVDQKVINGHKKPNDNPTIMMKIMMKYDSV